MRLTRGFATDGSRVHVVRESVQVVVHPRFVIVVVLVPDVVQVLLRLRARVRPNARPAMPGVPLARPHVVRFARRFVNLVALARQLTPLRPRVHVVHVQVVERAPIATAIRDDLELLLVRQVVEFRRVLVRRLRGVVVLAERCGDTSLSDLGFGRSPGSDRPRAGAQTVGAVSCAQPEGLGVGHGRASGAGVRHRSDGTSRNHARARKRFAHPAASGRRDSLLRQKSRALILGRDVHVEGEVCMGGWEEKFSRDLGQLIVVAGSTR